MIEILKVNPLAEALFYYFGKANKESVKNKLLKAVSENPRNKKAIEKNVKCAGLLEKKLDSKLSVDDALVNKYFKKFPDLTVSPCVGVCLAFVMVYSALILHMEYSTEKMYSFLRKRDESEIIREFYTSFFTRCETETVNNITIKDLAQRVEKLQISGEDKWNIMNAAANYEPHIEELLSLLEPAVDIIEGAASDYAAAWQEFSIRYANETLQMLLSANIDQKLISPPVDVTKITPLLLDFSRMNTAIFSKDDISVIEKNEAGEYKSCGKIFLGIAKHLISCETQKEDTLNLCEKLKVISDNTRLEMLFYLCSHCAYCQELCTKFKLQHSTISYHLAKLLNANFLTAELRDGQTFYTADKAGIRRMLDSFAEKIK